VDQHRFRVFEKRVLRGVSGHKKDEFEGNWRRLKNEELHTLYCSLNIIRVIKLSKIR
jgi:hypothetical protein